MAFSFGSTQPAQTPALGANPPPSAGFSFGTAPPAASSAPFSFGTAAQPQAGGFKIGTSSAAPTGTLSFGTSTAPPSFGFGTSSAPPTSTFGGFGTNTTSQASTFGFGTSTAPPTGTLGGFGATSTAPTFGFGSAAPTNTFGFGGSTLGSGGFGATATSAPLSFGTTTNAAPGFGFGAPAQAPAFGGFGLLSSASTGTAPNVMATATTAPSLGLGGISSAPFGASTAQGQSESKAYGETSVPAEIIQNVEDFKKFVKEQKAKKDEVSRGSSKAPEKVGEEVEGLKNILSTLANTIQQQTAIVHKLKLDAALEIKNAEIAQRTKETAPSMQLDNTAPLQYFARLVADFEQRMQFYKQQIEDTERNLVAINRQQSLTPQELMSTMKKLHEAFVLLAGRVHNIHTTLQNYKDDYLTYRRRVGGDASDIFARKGGQASQSKLAGSQTGNGVGPSPFGGTTDRIPRGFLTSGHQSGPNPASSNLHFASSLANNSVLTSSNQFGTPGRPSGLFGSSAQIQSPASSSFQLQSPPPGNKRNKR